MKLEEIKQHWEQSGEGFPHDSKVTPTSRDPYLGQLERENILSYLKEGDTCLEVGCGDAFHTVHYAKKVKQISAIDVAGSLIKIAQSRLQKNDVDNVDLSVCSVLEIDQKFNLSSFSRVISQRCLINLPEWEQQKDAVSKVHKLLKADGLFLLSEGFQDNLNNLNMMRTQFSLPEIKVVDYNRNLMIEDFEGFVRQHFEIVERRHYGPYLFFSRLYQPLVVFPDPPKHDSKLNEVAMNISALIPMPDLEKYSYNLFYVLRKK